MARLQVRAFTEGDVEAAAELLAARHRKHRRAQPLLDPGFESASACVPHVAAVATASTGSGAVALEGERMVGFLIGSEKSNTWGSNIWVEAAGLAVEHAEVMRDMYRVAAQRWFDEGRTSHFVIVPSSDAPLIDAWFRLGFGQQHAHAIQQPRRIPAAGDIVVRPARRVDLDVLAQLDLELPMHQDSSPVFSGGVFSDSGMPTLDEAKQDWLESLDDPRFTSFVADHDGRVVGAATGCSLEVSSSHGSLAKPANAGFLGFASVLPEARGLGAGRALGEAIIDWCCVTGYDSVVTDWRVTNLLASRAWPALGFETTFLRLTRTIGRAG